MQYKIAVGSRDGKVVTEHFGGCKKFAVLSFDTRAGTYNFEEFREVTPPCGEGGHTQSGLEAAAEKLSGCKAVLISRIGPGAESLLARKGIDVLVYTGLISDAAEKIIKYYKQE